MNCTNCGAEIKDGLKFCTNCGANLSQQVVQSEPAQAQTPTASMDVPATPEGAVPLQKRNTQRTIAIACGLLILLVVVFVGGLFLWKALTPKELLLDADTIKDEALLNTLTVKYDKDGDGKLSEEELGEVQTLELDSGNDYSYLYLFRNLTSVNVKNSDVTSLDLSKNDNLKNADFRDAPNIADIKLPNMPSYDDVKLPNNDDVNVTFPENSEYEVKYVPRKVEESYIFSGRESKTAYEQSVENAFKVNDLHVTRDSVSTTYNFVYDSDGRIKQTNSQYGSLKSTQNLTYDDNNRLVNEKFSAASGSSPYNGDYAIEYNDRNFVANVRGETVSYEGSQIEVKGTDGNVSYRWKLDNERIVSYVEHVGTNSYYMSHGYDLNKNSACDAESIECYLVKSSPTTPDGERLDSQEAPSSMSATVAYTYESNRLAKATFDNGFEQNYIYDSKGNLVSITSTGSPVLNYAQITATCSVEYSAVIAKKDQTPLTFIVLPGVSKRGIVNLSTDTRQIAVSSGWETADFAGKFWWDEENIINNQVEAAKAREALGNTDDTAELATANNDALNNEAKEAYKAKIAEYAQYQGGNVKTQWQGKFTEVNNLLLMYESDIYYTLYDLNNDGVDELLIKFKDSYSADNRIVDAFAYDNGEVKRLFASGERWSYELCKNGCLSYTSSSGAYSHTYGIYNYEGDFDFSYVTNYYTGAKMKIIREAGNESGNAYYVGEDGVRHECTKEEMNAETQKWPKMEAETINWTPITQNL